MVMSNSNSDSDSDSDSDAHSKLTKEEKIKKEARYLLRRRRIDGRSRAFLGAKIDRRWKVIIDGYNVARQLDSKNFDTKCIQMAVEYFEKLGCESFAVIHSFLEEGNTKGDFRITKENQELLKEMKKRKQVYTVPRQDYDDLYTVKYAMDENGLIVTNDVFHDFEKNRHFNVDMDVLRSRIISFSFVGSKFFINPQFECPTYPDDFKDDE